MDPVERATHLRMPWGGRSFRRKQTSSGAGIVCPSTTLIRSWAIKSWNLQNTAAALCVSVICASTAQKRDSITAIIDPLRRCAVLALPI
jgi:hypothetical protein